MSVPVWLLLASWAVVLFGSRTVLMRIYRGRRPSNRMQEHDIVLHTNHSFLDQQWDNVQLLGLTAIQRVFSPGSTVPDWELYAAQAGYPSLTLREFAAYRLVASTALALFLLALGLVAGSSQVFDFLLVLCGMGAGYIAPTMYLRQRIQQRRRKALAETTLWISGLVVLLTAGMTFQQALVELSERNEGILFREGRLVSQRLQLGTSPADALAEMARRVGVMEFTTIVQNVIRAQERGIQLRQGLSQQSEMLHTVIQQRIEERIGKNLLKAMVFMVLFAMPLFCLGIMSPIIFDFVRRFASP